MIFFSNTLCRQCWILSNLERGITHVHTVELDLRTVRYNEKFPSMSWVSSSYPPPEVGQSI